MTAFLQAVLAPYFVLDKDSSLGIHSLAYTGLKRFPLSAEVDFGKEIGNLLVLPAGLIVTSAAVQYQTDSYDYTLEIAVDSKDFVVDMGSNSYFEVETGKDMVDCMQLFVGSFDNGRATHASFALDSHN